jgi:hypothetical protein
VRSELTFVPVETLDEVIATALHPGDIHARAAFNAVMNLPIETESPIFP